MANYSRRIVSCFSEGRKESGSFWLSHHARLSRQHGTPSREQPRFCQVCCNVGPPSWNVKGNAKRTLGEALESKKSRHSKSVA